MQVQPRRREDWFDAEFVQSWIDGQQDRRAERTHQFARIAALVPFERDARFRYLNLGAGPGALDELLLSRFPKAEATLQDGSAVMLDHAREQLARFGERVSFAEGNLTEPSWVETVRGPFDLAVSSIAIHNLRDPRRIRVLYAEVFDLMAEGGFFMNLEYVRLSSPRLQPLAIWAAQDAEAGYLIGSGGAGSPGTAAEQLVWLREAGFAPVECFWKEFRLALIGGFKGEVRVPEVSR